MDNCEPRFVRFTQNDEELSKQICAVLLPTDVSTIVIDNAKVAKGSINSPTLEALITAPVISLRILGHSRNLNRQNDIQFLLTINNASIDHDSISRGLGVRLYHEGRPETRQFSGPDPVKFAAQHRQQILGELAGMVEYWKACGRPLSAKPHRAREWAGLVGGILEATGFPEFLCNTLELESELSTVHGELTALAEAVVAECMLINPPHFNAPDNCRPIDWERFFLVAKINVIKPEQPISRHRKAKAISDFLRTGLEREVKVLAQQGTGTATLRRKDGPARSTFYYFEFVFEDNPTLTGLSCLPCPSVVAQAENVVNPITPASAAPAVDGAAIESMMTAKA